MSLSKDKKEAFNKLLKYREDIEHDLQKIEALLKLYFPEEYQIAYQYWIPQIKTALKDNSKWLSRGDYSMDYTIKRLMDKMVDEIQKGVTKYIG